MSTCINRMVAAALLFLFFVSPAIAGDEICVVNKSNISIEAGSAGTDSSNLAPNEAFCISVDLVDDGPTAAGGVGIWVRGPNSTYVEVDIEDPMMGDLKFTSNGTQFDGADLDGPTMLAAQKGDDGVYRFIVQ